MAKMIKKVEKDINEESLLKRDAELNKYEKDLNTREIKVSANEVHLNNLDKLEKELQSNFIKKEEEVNRLKEELISGKHEKLKELNDEFIKESKKLNSLKDEHLNLMHLIETNKRNQATELETAKQDKRTQIMNDYNKQLDIILKDTQNQIDDYSMKIRETSSWSETSLQKEFDMIINNFKTLRENSLASLEKERKEIELEFQKLETREEELSNIRMRETKALMLEKQSNRKLEEIDKIIEQRLKQSYDELVEANNKLIDDKKNLQQKYFDLETEINNLQNDIINSDKLDKITIQEKNIELSRKLIESERKNIKYSNDEVEELSRKAQSYEHASNQVNNLKIEIESLNKQLSNLKGRNEDFDDLVTRNRTLHLNRRIQEDAITNLELKLEKLEDDFFGTTTGNETKKIIEKPNDKFLNKKQDNNLKISEKEWIETTFKACNSEGFKIDKRMFISFHTSLKTADMAPLTVLAGVSGTGKSKLPQLYSKHGGIHFISVPVQPDWDSPQSLFGYYNSIDKKFNPTLLLQSIVPFQLENENNKLKDDVVMVLLDEMNLAYVELYFSDLLSKLEEKRGDDNTYVSIPVGEDQYKIQLTNNVLWIGTMNEDETTKTLSDKVVDRGNIISFPRPKELANYRKVTIEEKQEERSKINKQVWYNWLNNAVIFEDELNVYKEMIEHINELLLITGKAVGHRVWQAIQCYIGNHPKVIEFKDNKDKREIAIKYAFEEAFVHKIVPKLRGIETDGFLKENCLDKIAELLTDFTIKDDFDNAIREENGSFSWNTALYLSKGYEGIEG